MNKTDTERGRTKIKQKGKKDSLDSFQQGRNLRWLPRNGMNKVDMVRFKLKF